MSVEGQKTGDLELSVAAPLAQKALDFRKRSGDNGAEDVIARRSPGAAETASRPMKTLLLPLVLAAALTACAPASEAPAPAAPA
jgi:hypothetical protein